MKTRFILQILYRNASMYLRYLRIIDKKSEQIEEKLHLSTRNQELMELLELEKSLVYFTTSLRSNEMVLEKLLKVESIKKYPEDTELLEDVIIENKQPDDDIERGYYDRPYKRYEAEPDRCAGNASFLSPTVLQTELQSEASNQMAAQLTEKGSYIQWTNDEAADGLTIRFSLPDSEDGKGTKGTLALYVNDEYVQDITLDSYWAWQYTLKYGNNKYPDNTPASNKFPRMRFDESHYKLAKKIPAGSTFKIVKTTDNSSVYTIDFIELEPIPAAITFDDITDDNKIIFDDPTKNLGAFIQVNGGKTIFIPEGRYEVDRKINITSDNTKIIGAGMWYTELYFTASSDDRSTYNKRGIETDNSNIVIEGLYINTINNKRYYDNNANYQVGKGFMGSFGANSIIRNVWVEHFECGGWIANYNGKNSDNLLIQHSRFRNNYADGLNLCIFDVRLALLNVPRAINAIEKN